MIRPMDPELQRTELTPTERTPPDKCPDPMPLDKCPDLTPPDKCPDPMPPDKYPGPDPEPTEWLPTTEPTLEPRQPLAMQLSQATLAPLTQLTQTIKEISQLPTARHPAQKKPWDPEEQPWDQPIRDRVVRQKRDRYRLATRLELPYPLPLSLEELKALHRQVQMHRKWVQIKVAPFRLLPRILWPVRIKAQVRLLYLLPP